MYLRFNQDKMNKQLNFWVAMLFNFINSLAIAVMCYGILNIVLVVVFDLDIDVISLEYVLIFVAVFAVAFICMIIYFLKAKRGIVIDENQIIIRVGYFAKYQYLRNIIEIDDIVKMEYVDKYNLKEIKKANGGFGIFSGYLLIQYGVCLKNRPAVIITCSGGNFQNDGVKYVVSCENPEKLIEAYNSFKK